MITTDSSSDSRKPELAALSDAPASAVPEPPRLDPVGMEVAPQKLTVADSEIFRFLGTYWIYQDQIGWNRTQTLVAVEAAVLAGAFAKSGPLSAVILVLGAVLVGRLYKLILRDWQIRDALGQELQEQFDKYQINLLPPPNPGLPRGRSLVRRIAIAVIVCNLTLAALRVALLFDPYIPECIARAIVWMLH